MKISIVGVGYVGLVTGACLSKAGHNVLCVEQSNEKVSLLKDGIVPFYEPGLKELVRDGMETGRLAFTSQMEEAVPSDVIIIAVGTPNGHQSGCVDLSPVETVVRSLGEILTSDSVIVIKSTVPVGTAHKMTQLLLRQLRKRKLSLDIDVVSNPEFLKEGMAIRDFTQPDRIIVGCQTRRSRQVLEEVYAPFVRLGHQIIFMDQKAAELTKYAANAFLATKISFMNEMAGLAEQLGVDVEKVKRGIGSDHRIGYEHLNPGVGYGGSCFPKDVKALLHFGEEAHFKMKILKSVAEVNHEQKHRFLKKVFDVFNQNLDGRKVVIWGLSFKPDTDDLREAPSIDIVSGLLSKGAEVWAYDPIVTKDFLPFVPSSFSESFHFASDPYSPLKEADGLILLTEWTSFKAPDFEKMALLMRNRTIFDGRNQYDPRRLKEFGFYYYGVGRDLHEIPTSSDSKHRSSH